MEYLLIKKDSKKYSKEEIPVDIGYLCTVLSTLDTPITHYKEIKGTIFYNKKNNNFTIGKKSKVLDLVLSGEISETLIFEMGDYGIEFLKIKSNSN